MTDNNYALTRSVQHLEREMREVQALSVRIVNDVGTVNGQVAAVSSAQQQTRSELAFLTAEFQSYVQKAERTANVQRAETRVGNLEARIEFDFGRYDRVRRTAAGLVAAFDSGLVQQESVATAGDMLMIENPKYWLAPAVVGLGAWSGGDVVLCDQAIEAAYGLAPSRTALMFALILRRQRRAQSSVTWLRHYLKNLDPTALSREFAVVLESVAQGAFGASGRQIIHENVDQWLAAMADAEDAHAAQVKRWRVEVERFRPDGAGAQFERLRAHSPQWPVLEEMLQGAETHKPFHEYYNALISAEYHPSDRVEDSIDDILDILVSEYDNEELPLRRELAFEKAIIEYEGDRDRAREIADAGSAALGDTLDYLTVQSSAALSPESIGVSPATQQVALASCVDWVERAHAAYTMDYRAKYPADVQVEFQEKQPIGSAVFTLPPWRGSLTNTPMPELTQSLGSHWDKSSSALLATLRFNFGKAMVAPSVVSGLLLLVFIAVNPVFAIIAAGAVFGFWYLGVNSRRKAADALYTLVDNTIRGMKAKALEELRATGAEYVDYQDRYRAADGREAGVRSLVASFGDLGHDKAPHEGRTLIEEGPRA
jgi:hypothetical protein